MILSDLESTVKHIADFTVQNCWYCLHQACTIIFCSLLALGIGVSAKVATHMLYSGLTDFVLIFTLGLLCSVAFSLVIVVGLGILLLDTTVPLWQTGGQVVYPNYTSDLL